MGERSPTREDLALVACSDDPPTPNQMGYLASLMDDNCLSCSDLDVGEGYGQKLLTKGGASDLIGEMLDMRDGDRPWANGRRT